MSAQSQLRSEVMALSSTERKQLAIEAAQSLNTDDRRAVASALPDPSPSVADKIWTWVVAAFLIVFVGAFLAMAVYLYKGKEVDKLLTVFTTASAFLAGLLAPSPVTQNNDSGR